MNKLIFGFLLCLSVSSLFAQTTVEERLAHLEEKVEEINLDRAFDRVHFSGTFITNVEILNSVKTDPTTGEKDKNYGELAGLHVGLNIDFNISEHLDFFTTIAMGKMYNSDSREGISEGSYHSLEGSYAYTGSDAKFDVAYLRWKAFDNRLSLALGRMTTRGGPPLNQLDALYRNGTYPRFSYNAIFDGIAVVYDLRDFMPKDMSFKTRLFYTPYFFTDSNDRTAAQLDPDGNKVNRRSDQVAWLNEWDYNDSTIAKKISIYSMLWYYDSYYDAGYQDTGRPGPEYYRALSHTLYVGLERIRNTGLNFSWSYLQIKDYLDGTGPAKSNSSLFNVNYNFEKGYVVGVEHISTDKNFYLDEYAYLQFNEFYQRSNNKGQHYFFAIPFSHNQVIRFGLYDYKAGVAPANLYLTNDRTQNIYTSYRIDF
jgi:hypothetical protein